MPASRDGRRGLRTSQYASGLAAQGAQPAGRQHRSDQGLAPQGYAMARQGGMHDLVVLVKAQHAAGAQTVQAACLQPTVPLQPGARRVVEFEQNLFVKVVLIQPVQVQCRMGHRQDRLAEQPQGVLTGLFGRAVADSDIHALAIQVHETVVGRHPDIDVRVDSLESSQTRQQPQRSHTYGGCDRDGQTPARGAPLCAQLGQLDHPGGGQSK
ncbi:hypothetical protein F783_010305 [Bordetella holmesii F627]|nr:hypothetical protein H558_07795 [Bordetella holmesii H558]AMD50591.1 hypothetical protein F783_010305 [Bordetella holmesii F627]AOB34294.1 hypothetical protein BBB42_01555 [Bordetella holmesii]SUV91317.1 Uncharacterised protein [Bordetella holmesii]